MMLGRRRCLLFCALITGVAGCAGTADKKKKTEKETRTHVPKEKKAKHTGKRMRAVAKVLTVDCKSMCTMTFKRCVGEVLVASGKLSQDKYDLIVKSGSLKRVQDAGYAHCVRECKRKSGFEADAEEMNKCLKIADCKTYAACIKVHIK